MGAIFVNTATKRSNLRFTATFINRKAAIIVLDLFFFIDEDTENICL